MFVVSEDGPLTVYTRGEPIARLDSLYSDAQTHPNEHNTQNQDQETADEPHDRRTRAATRS